MKNLTGKIAIVLLLACFALGIYFSSGSLTGNIIGNLSSDDYSIIAFLFLMAGVIGSYVYLKFLMR